MQYVPAGSDYGFARGRRRGAALLVSNAVSHRLRKARRTHGLCFKGMSNAFASGYWPNMDEAVQQFVSEEDQALCRLRYGEAVVALPAAEGGRVVMKTQQGGLMGDPFTAQAFTGTFQAPIADWRRDVEQADSCCTELTAKWESLTADLSHFKYADDIHSIVLADYSTTLPQFIDQLKHRDRLLNDRLSPVGFGQDMQKQ
eukprot:2801641-Pyramimonas_sp.AAC.1